MGFDDIMVLLLLAVADVCLIVFLRRRRARYMRMDRITRSLQLHIRSELDAESPRARRLRVLAAR
jgi:hypothetical protein